jgi:predicted transcriptional regulator
VHKLGCSNLIKAEPDRIISLAWPDITAKEEFCPEDDYKNLDKLDFSILGHHRDYGFDYSLKVAAMLHLDKKTVFDRHGKLRDMGLLERVEPRMIQYRKNIVKGKWIKHRNHTYYDLTEKGRKYLDYYAKGK